MSYPRRRFLQTGGAVTVAALAGCASVNKSDDSGSDGGSGGSGGSGGDGTSTDGTSENEQGGTAQLWHGRPKGPKKSLQKNVEAFGEDSPHSVKLSEIGDVKKKLENAIPAGKGPHTYQWAHDWIGEFQPAGFMSDQSGNLKVDLASTYTKPAAEAVQFKGGTYGLPWAAETVSVLYNKEMVDSPPKTVSEMESVMKEHHDPGNGKYGLSYPIDPYFASPYAQAFGGFYYDEKKDSLGLTKPKTLKGFRFIRDKLAKYVAEDYKYDPQAAVFKEGNAPFAINGPWHLGTVRDAGLDVGVAPLPTPEGGEPNPYTTVKMWHFAKKMEKGGANAEAARKWAEWHTTNTEALKGLAVEHGFIPVHKELAGSDELPAATKAFSESVAMGEPIPTHKHMGAVWDPLKNALLKVVKGDQKPKPAFETAEKTIKDAWK